MAERSKPAVGFKSPAFCAKRAAASSAPTRNMRTDSIMSVFLHDPAFNLCDGTVWLARLHDYRYEIPAIHRGRRVLVSTFLGIAKLQAIPLTKIVYGWTFRK